MADNKLEIILEADVAKATKDIQGATKAITGLGDAAGKSTGKNLSSAATGVKTLSSEASTASGGLLQLAGSLIGPVGIATAIGAVTSALIAFAPQIREAITGIGELELAQRDAAEKGAAAYAKANDQFSNFLRIASDSGNSIERQNDALKKANNLLDDYGLTISNLSTFQKKGAEIGAIYSQIKQEEAKSTLLAARAAEAYVKSVAITTKQQQGDLIGLFGDLSLGDKISTVFSAATPGGAVSSVFEGVGNSLADLKKEEDLYNQESAKTKVNIDKLIASIGAIDGVTEKFGGTVKKAKIENENWTDTFDAPRLTDITTRIGDQASAYDQLSAAILKAHEAQNKKNFSDKAAALIATRQNTQTAPADLAKGIKVPQAISDVQTANLEKSKLLMEQIATATSNTNAAFALLSPAIDQAFNALANGENAAEAVGQALKQMIIQLVKAVIQAAILSAILSAIAPGAAQASGGFGGILGGILGFKANGGPVNAGGAYMVGDAGPELFVPTTAGQIVSGIGSMGGGGGSLSARISGNDLLFILNNAGKNRSTNFG